MSIETQTTQVFRSARREGLYLYLRDDCCFEDLPKAVREAFGRPEKALELQLHPERRLARVDVNEVLAALDEHGFFVQLPPQSQLEGGQK